MPRVLNSLTKPALRLVGGILVVAGVVVSLFFGQQVWRGASNEVPSGIDAIAVFAGGSVARLERAAQLQRRHPGATLFVNDAVAEWVGGAEVTRRLCDESAAVGEVVCVGALEDSTRGEVRAFAGLMNSRGHDQVVVVSASYHVPRVARWMRRCFSGRVYGVGTYKRKLDLQALLHEVAGHWLATLLPARCDSLENTNPNLRV